MRETNQKLREQILETASGTVRNIFNANRFLRFFDEAFVRSLLGLVESFEVLYISSSEVDSRILQLAREFPCLRVECLTLAQLDLQTEILISGNRVFFADENGGEVIESEALAHDMNLLFDKLSAKATPGTGDYCEH